ncbi:MAG: thermonuclease family protein [Candidatus Peribacteria bacterium]|nr:MAG: thermonuclease family protein [Candidatus Peribacteria bacterium]
MTHELLETKTVLAEVVRVIDGDTIEVLLPQGKEKLRLIGVDTPETKHPKKEVEYYGIEAYEFTKTQLTGKKVQIHFEGINHRDKYNRLLGYVYIPGESGSFNETLIREGYARAYLRFPFLYQDSFALLEKQARKEERGMWKDTEVKKLMLAEAREEKKEIVAVSMGNTLSFLETYNFSPFLFPPPLFPEGGSGSTHFLSFSSPWKDTAILSQKSIGVEIKDVP